MIELKNIVTTVKRTSVDLTVNEMGSFFYFIIDKNGRVIYDNLESTASPGFAYNITLMSLEDMLEHNSLKDITNTNIDDLTLIKVNIDLEYLDEYLLQRHNSPYNKKDLVTIDLKTVTFELFKLFKINNDKLMKYPVSDINLTNLKQLVYNFVFKIAHKLKNLVFCKFINSTIVLRTGLEYQVFNYPDYVIQSGNRVNASRKNYYDKDTQIALELLSVNKVINNYHGNANVRWNCCGLHAVLDKYLDLIFTNDFYTKCKIS